MRENRTYGSEGGEGQSPSLPLSEFLGRWFAGPLADGSTGPWPVV